MEKSRIQANAAAALLVSAEATTEADRNNRAANLSPNQKTKQVGHTLGSYQHRGYRARVPLKPNSAPPASGTTAASTTTCTGTPAEKSSEASQPSREQKELVRLVQSGTIISILWRHGRRMGYDHEGKIVYYSGEDEYYRAKIMRWKQFRRRRTFRLIYDDGYCENEVPLIEETFRILELQDSDVVEQEGGLFVV